ncbi:hypothetical protein L6452_36954 [Arctium lappa]|uniref:Uncharacterized protein n=1 Tax=Arctium lappa TaxID=4217 RepID=A0ACB8Y0X3_ARCLA|nr:hypothetical protein L6452_36954 [Arctium lappa]
MDQATLVASKNVKFSLTESEVPKNNHLARLEFDAEKYPHLVDAAAFLKQSCIAYALFKSLRFPAKTNVGFDSLPTDTKLIMFLDDMEYSWENKPRSKIPNKKLTKIQKANM